MCSLCAAPNQKSNGFDTCFPWNQVAPQHFLCLPFFPLPLMEKLFCCLPAQCYVPPSALSNCSATQKYWGPHGAAIQRVYMQIRVHRETILAVVRREFPEVLTPLQVCFCKQRVFSAHASPATQLKLPSLKAAIAYWLEEESLRDPLSCCETIFPFQLQGGTGPWFLFFPHLNSVSISAL